MGMAASQARLLTITARQHDVEYKAQSIQNAKIQLATQQDEAYKEYLEALDATTLTVKDWEGNRITATFNNLCGVNAVDIATGNKYAFRDSRGRLIVTDEVKNKYDSYTGGDDPYEFAFYAMGVSQETLASLHTSEAAVNAKYETLDSETQIAINGYVDQMKQAIGDKYINDKNSYYYLVNPDHKLSDLVKRYNDDTDTTYQKALDATQKRFYENAQDDDPLAVAYKLYKPFSSSKDPNLHLAGQSALNSDTALKQKLTELYNKIEKLAQGSRHKLYLSHAEEIFRELGKSGNSNKYDNIDFDADKFDFYVRMYKEIQASGGECISINDYDGTIVGYENEKKHAADDSEWLQNMIKCGKITVDLVNTDKKTGAVSFASTGVPSDSILEYTTTTTMDKSAMAKAEAEYEHKNKQINQKDKQYDMDLAKLDTERSALKKEYDSITKVIDENIERTFGIFS